MAKFDRHIRGKVGSFVSTEGSDAAAVGLYMRCKTTLAQQPLERG